MTSIQFRTGSHQSIGGRSNQEDAFGVFPTRWGTLLVVADGMGGAAGGEVASHMAINTLIHTLNEDQISNGAVAALDNAVKTANAAVFIAAMEDPTLKGMGSTLVSVLLQDETYFLAHVGDSRAYLLRSGELKCLTRDHTRVREMLDANLLTPEEAAEHPESHVLSRNIGGRERLEAEVSGPHLISPGDHFLLCSDGLWDVLEDAWIQRILNEEGSPEARAAWLVEAVIKGPNSEGPSDPDHELDNITVVVATFDKQGPFPPTNRPHKGSDIILRRGLLSGLLLGIGSLAFLVTAWGIRQHFRSRQPVTAPIPVPPPVLTQKPVQTPPSLPAGPSPRPGNPSKQHLPQLGGNIQEGRKKKQKEPGPREDVPKPVPPDQTHPDNSHPTPKDQKELPNLKE